MPNLQNTSSTSTTITSLSLFLLLLIRCDCAKDLTPQSFAKDQQSGRLTLVFFHNGNLERLKSIIEMFEKADTLLQRKEIGSGMFDCSLFPDFASQLNIQQLPMIMAFR
jgi:hypothetical protein